MPDDGSLFRDMLHRLTNTEVLCWTVTLRLYAQYQALYMKPFVHIWYVPYISYWPTDYTIGFIAATNFRL